MTLKRVFKLNSYRLSTAYTQLSQQSFSPGINMKLSRLLHGCYKHVATVLYAAHIATSISFVCSHFSHREKLNKGVLLYIHLNLSIALLLALALFVGGIEPATVNEVRGRERGN